MKTIVFVPVFFPDMSYASRPSLFLYKCAHTAFVLGFAIRWQYSSSSPLSPITELVISQSHVMGNLHCDSWDGEILYIGLDMSMHDSIASCIILCDLVVHCSEVGLSSSS
jgi:hypothetical protein